MQDVKDRFALMAMMNPGNPFAQHANAKFQKMSPEKAAEIGHHIDTLIAYVANDPEGAALLAAGDPGPLGAFLMRKLGPR